VTSIALRPQRAAQHVARPLAPSEAHDRNRTARAEAALGPLNNQENPKNSDGVHGSSELHWLPGEADDCDAERVHAGGGSGQAVPAAVLL